MAGVVLLVRFPVRRRRRWSGQCAHPPAQKNQARDASPGSPEPRANLTTPFPSRPQSPSDGFLASFFSLERAPPSPTTVPGSSIDSCVCCCCCRPLEIRSRCCIDSHRSRPTTLTPPPSRGFLLPHPRTPPQALSRMGPRITMDLSRNKLVRLVTRLWALAVLGRLLFAARHLRPL